MIYLVHGDDYAKSRKLIANQKVSLNAAAKYEFDIKKVTPETLAQYVRTEDLFGEKSIVVINISESQSKDLEPFLGAIEKTTENVVLIILSSKKLPATHILVKKSKELKIKIVENNVEQQSNIFTFVDNLFYKRRAQTYKEYELLQKEGQDDFYIFSMILYGLRNIAHAKFNSNSFENQKPFVKNKASTQAKSFTDSKIIELFNVMYNIDKELKTGMLTPEMALTLSIEKILI